MYLLLILVQSHNARDAPVRRTGKTMRRPALSELPQLVDTAVRDVRLYRYPVPAHLAGVLNAEAANLTARQTALVRKHPYLRLELQLQRHLPERVWTDDASKATFFVVPHAYAHATCRRPQDIQIVRPYVQNAFARFLEHVQFAMPFFNRSGGRDHIIMWTFENGPFCDCAFRRAMANEPRAFGMLQAMIKVGYYGHKDFAMYGWNVGHDVMMPMYTESTLGPARSWQSALALRRASFGFSGSFWGTTVTCDAVRLRKPAREPLSILDQMLSHAHDCACSPGIRKWLQTHLAKNCSEADGIPVGTNDSLHRCTSAGAQARSITSFWHALCPAGWACWSSRLFHAIRELVVPAIMANGAIQPFESILDWSRFSIQLDTNLLMSGDTSQLEQLHQDSLTAATYCGRCVSCHKCSRLALVQRMQYLERVRKWLVYNASDIYSVFGLFLVELHARQRQRRQAAGART